jgi:hypothetical protein
LYIYHTTCLGDVRPLMFYFSHYNFSSVPIRNAQIFYIDLTTIEPFWFWLRYKSSENPLMHPSQIYNQTRINNSTTPRKTIKRWDLIFHLGEYTMYCLWLVIHHLTEMYRFTKTCIYLIWISYIISHWSKSETSIALFYIIYVETHLEPSIDKLKSRT